MRHTILLLLTSLLLTVAGCAGPPVSNFQPSPTHSPYPWTNQAFKNDPADFQFAVVSDRSGRMRPGVFRETVKKLNLLQPEFVICVGDLISGYTMERNILEWQYDEIDEILGGLEMRFFRVAGNHDITNPLMLAMYNERYGQPYYHFLYKDVLFLIVLTDDPPDPNNPRSGRISQAQADYMKKVMNENRDVRWTWVFMHKPLFTKKENSVAGWTEIENALSGRPHTVMAGHWHYYGKYRKHGQSYIRLATTGGGSKLRGLEEGEFDHIVWVTMTDEGPRVANLMLDGIHDEDVKLAE